MSRPDARGACALSGLFVGRFSDNLGRRAAATTQVLEATA
jgi:hypothetical protein